MKNIIKLHTIAVPESIKEIYKVNSQPGDSTRYSYICMKCFGGYKFISDDSLFKFPEWVQMYQIETVPNKPLRELSDLELDIVKRISEYYGCNPNTTLECIRTAREIEKIDN